MNYLMEYSFLLPASVAAAASLMLFVRKDRTVQQVWLAHAFMVTMLTMIALYLYQNAIWIDSPAFDLLTIALVLSAAPCYFIYVASQTSPQGLQMQHFLIFLPAVLMTGLNALADVLLGGDRVRDFLSGLHAGGMPDLSTEGAVLFKYVVDSNLLRGCAFILTVSVFVHAKFAFRRYDGILEDFYSDGGEVFINYDDVMKWALGTMICAMLLMCSVPFSVFACHGTVLIAISVLLSLSLLVILHAGLRMYGPAEELAADNGDDAPQQLQAEDDDTIQNHEMRGYKDKISRGLRAFIAQKGYLDPNISVSQLSQMLDTNRVYLSETIKEVYGQSFSEFTGSESHTPRW